MTPKQSTTNNSDNSNLEDVLEEILESEDSDFQNTETHDVLNDNSFDSVQYEQEILDVIKLYKNPNLAVMILDKNLTIIYSTPKTAELFQDYYKISNKPFFNIFYNTLEQNEMMKFILAIKSVESGFSWTGTLKHKTPKTRTLHTRTNLVPFFSVNHAIAGFQVFFENTTETYHLSLRSTFKSILEASKLKDNETGLHNERVSYYCKKMSECLYEAQKYPQIDPDFIENIGFLAAMHDVGKIGTPDYILQKPGKLTDLEWDIMREHTINGTFILSSYPVPMAKEVALSHHEWWNGSGYPFKLENEMIPLSARILTIADVYDALRMKRSYKNEFTHEEAVKKIIAGSGTQFDPSLILVFEEMQQEYNSIWNLLRDPDSYDSTTNTPAADISESL